MKKDGSLDPAYAARLKGLQKSRLKQMLDVQRPYRWNLRRLKPGRTLDIGCGIGRNLAHLGTDGVGVDPNPACVAAAREAGFEAYSPEMLPPMDFDTLLVSHVLEHVEQPTALVGGYLDRLRPDGRLIIMTPQEAGFASDETHVRFLDFAALAEIVAALGFSVERSFSFPFPRWAGRLFKYNEFVLVARRR
jgi:SAM-dependent methyltransferase